MPNFREKYNLIIILFLWVSIFSLTFYIGSINSGIWGRWQGLEIVIPLIISFFIASIITLPLYLISIFIKNKKK